MTPTKPETREDLEFELKGAAMELERIDRQIKGLTDNINDLGDKRNKAHKYERWIKEETEIRRAKLRDMQ